VEYITKLYVSVVLTSRVPLDATTYAPSWAANLVC
jgi:hypothetical protein